MRARQKESETEKRARDCTKDLFTERYVRKYINYIKSINTIHYLFVTFFQQYVYPLFIFYFFYYFSFMVFQLVETQDIKASPTGQIPYVYLDGDLFSDSSFIIDSLITKIGLDPTEGLSSEQQGIARAITKVNTTVNEFRNDIAGIILVNVLLNAYKCSITNPIQFLL